MITLQKLLIAATFILSTAAYADTPSNPPPKKIQTGPCPLCGRNWEGVYHGEIEIPSTLTAPKNKLWVQRLREALSLEKLSEKQYEADYEKYQVPMPYMMIIPQEHNHIAWITSLLKAFGASIDVPVKDIIPSKSIKEAYEVARDIEADLIPKYEWLISNSEDDISRYVINSILFQTRMHYAMFGHTAMMINMWPTPK